MTRIQRLIDRLTSESWPVAIRFQRQPNQIVVLSAKVDTTDSSIRISRLEKPDGTKDAQTDQGRSRVTGDQ